jgi:hypothetical protein
LDVCPSRGNVAQWACAVQHAYQPAARCITGLHGG